ncbi:Hypothetical protein FKW44_005774 [Caligus rogercresseyi]|uniref:Uncharacterized protein n=1 Tax=Caligus rogercresseyi TaxID=217165 RepID=A0A7T8QSB0_CALRO|nr:Hypothetical protein FKW44_005774 [Caligus rogercresseyi]
MICPALLTGSHVMGHGGVHPAVNALQSHNNSVERFISQVTKVTTLVEMITA